MIEIPLSQRQVRQLRKYFHACDLQPYPRRGAVFAQVWRLDHYRTSTKDRRAGPLLRVAFLDPDRAFEVRRALQTPMIPYGYGIPAPGKEGP